MTTLDKVMAETNAAKVDKPAEAVQRRPARRNPLSSPPNIL